MLIAHLDEYDVFFLLLLKPHPNVIKIGLLGYRSDQWVTEQTDVSLVTELFTY